jgi:hypothetical protein
MGDPAGDAMGAIVHYPTSIASRYKPVFCSFAGIVMWTFEAEHFGLVYVAIPVDTQVLCRRRRRVSCSFACAGQGVQPPQNRKRRIPGLMDGTVAQSATNSRIFRLCVQTMPRLVIRYEIQLSATLTTLTVFYGSFLNGIQVPVFWRLKHCPVRP